MEGVRRPWMRSTAAALTDAVDRRDAADRPRAEFRLLGHLEVGDGDALRPSAGRSSGRCSRSCCSTRARWSRPSASSTPSGATSRRPPRRPSSTATSGSCASALEATSATLSTRSAGYVLDIPGGSLDVAQFERLERARPAGAPGRRRAGCPPAAGLGARPVARPGPRRARRRRVHPRRAVAPRVAPPRDDAGPDRRRPAARRRGRGRGRAGGARPRASARRGHPRPADGGALPHRQPGGGARGLPGHPSGARGGAGPRPVAQPAGARGRDPAPGSVAGPAGPGARTRIRRPGAAGGDAGPPPRRGGGRLPVRRPRDLRRQRCGRLLRARAPRVRDGRAPRRARVPRGRSARRAAASRRRCGPGSCRRSRPAPSATRAGCA